MQCKLNIKIKDILINGTIAQRVYVCEKDFKYFALYYFHQFFTHPIADFHYDFYDDLMKLSKYELDELAWICFRESAKTSITKMFLCWCICYKKKRYINYDSYDKANAEAALFDVAVWLQTNPRIIADFGQLYYGEDTDNREKQSKIQRLNNFITANRIKVEAFSTQRSTLGRIYKHYRPDLFILDDIENMRTKVSYPVTQKIKDHIGEMRAGLPANAGVIYLGNYITEDGVISDVMKNVENNPKGQLRFIPVEIDGKIAWKGKYVRTNTMANKLNNKISNPFKYKISLQHRLEKLGEIIYETFMMNNPEKSGDLVFNRGIIKELLKNAKDTIKEVAGLKIWREFKANHRFGLGADTSEGKGLDANALVIIDYSTRPAAVAATFEDNEIAPNLFAHEVSRAGLLYGECIAAPEINNTGWATLAELQTIPYENIHVREIKHKRTQKISNEYGIRMTTGVKYDIISNFVSAVEDGELIIYDIGLLNECYYYKKQDLNAMKMENGMTRHFDKLMAAAIAWEMRKYARLSKTEQKQIFFNKQKPYDK